jgi:AraC family transcriptional regulator of adaptative response/methylated-DNA-[protein]-cysteine methyltransferase
MRKDKNISQPSARQAELFDKPDSQRLVHPTLLIGEEDVSLPDPSDARVITYGNGYTKFGQLFMAATEQGICRADFDRSAGEVFPALMASFPTGQLVPGWLPVFDEVLKIFSEDTLSASTVISVHLRGTPFQLSVWSALAEIPFGQRVTYTELAAGIGRPDAVRAVGTAIGRNPVAWLVPCHRVVHTGGRIGQYMWGAERKRALLAWEAGDIKYECFIFPSPGSGR